MIKGFRGTSVVDYPGKIASVVFLGGCNWRCPYCYNVDLVLPERLKNLPDLPEEGILSDLLRRKGFIKGVVITGGEPTIWGRRLKAFLERIKYETKLAVKLDTNGSNPELVASLLAEGLVDYLAMDFKTAPSRYSELSADFEPVEKTLELLKDLNGCAEVRITLAPGLVAKQDLEEMLPYLKRVKRVALQKFVPEAETLAPDFPRPSLPPDTVSSLADYLRKHLSAEILIRC
ncbi:MAG TPA: anaerobic ribonucleoside-triphosphate reductase activating protein [Thermodesulfobacteriaceae bacterium]|nr:anaerobic ribonucleoside-triphosphate reductase activating protein [Thermodesulfobacteriaceae bacterium]